MSTPATGTGIVGLLQRAWASWDSFWFKPTDPTTLGVMRIIAGVLTLYVLAAYTPDMQQFFGKEAFFDNRATEAWRKDTPIVIGPPDWVATEPSVVLPAVPKQRIEVLGWLRSLGDSTDRARKLAYLHDLHAAGPGNSFNDDVRTALGFAQLLGVTDPKERDEMLARLEAAGKRNAAVDAARKAMQDAERPGTPPAVLLALKGKLDEAENERERGGERDTKETRIPPWMIRTLTADQARKYAADLRAFIGALPPANEGKEFVVTWLQAFYPNHTFSDPRDKENTPRSRFLAFLDRMPEDQAGRDQVLDYIDLWNVDPHQAQGRGMFGWSWLYHVEDPRLMYPLHFACIGVTVLFTLGLWTRVTSILTWIAVISYTQRAQQAYVFGMDTMMNIALVYLMIGPSGAALSLDRLIERYRQMRAALRAGTPATALANAGPTPLASACFATRLFQIHFCFIYMASGLSKLKGNSWWDNTATWYTLVNPEFCPTNNSLWLALMAGLCAWRPLWSLAMTGGVAFTLGLEISLPFLVWNKRLRPFMVAGGFMLHLGIGLIMGLSVFSLFMMTLLLSFIPPEAWRARLRLPGLPKLKLRVGGEAGARAASWLFAFDAWRQIEAVEATPKSDKGLEVVTAAGTAVSGKPALESAAKTLRLLRPFSRLVTMFGGR